MIRFVLATCHAGTDVRKATGGFWKASEESGAHQSKRIQHTTGLRRSIALETIARGSALVVSLEQRPPYREQGRRVDADRSNDQADDDDKRRGRPIIVDRQSGFGKTIAMEGSL